MSFITEPTLVTTLDNPFSPFTEFAEWFAYDMRKGYNTCGLLARYCIPDEISDDDDTLLAQLALVRESDSQMHVLVTEKTFDAIIKTQY